MDSIFENYMSLDYICKDTLYRMMAGDGEGKNIW